MKAETYYKGVPVLLCMTGREWAFCSCMGNFGQVDTNLLHPAYGKDGAGEEFDKFKEGKRMDYSVNDGAELFHAYAQRGPGYYVAVPAEIMEHLTECN
jgi:hypothetical protein